MLTPDAGSGQTLGYDVVREAAAIKREVGYMTQRFGLYDDLTLRENLDFVARVYGMDQRRQRVDATLERLGLQSRQKQLAGSLSGGWKQRLALAACMLHQPRLLLLDEPTAGVDPQARREFWDEIHRLAHAGITVLVSTHYMDEAERCHRLGYIAYGRLLATGTPEQLVQQSGLSTWAVRGPAPLLHALMPQLQARPGVSMVTRFGHVLHVSGQHSAELSASMDQGPWPPGVSCAPESAVLEDVFIHLMRQAQAAQALAGTGEARP